MNSSERKEWQFKAWLWSYNIVVGLIGSVLNSYILYIFISERHSMITSVNAMIW